jgi:ribosomal protein L32E
MGRIESKTPPPLLVTYDDESVPGDSYSRFSGQAPLTDESPPPYIDASSTESPRRHEPLGVRSVLLHDQRDIISSTTHQDANGSRTTVISRSLTSDPKRLQSFISTQTRLMPTPWVRVVGTHTDTRQNKKSKETTIVTDFDISISASDLLTPAWRRTGVIENGMRAFRGGRWKSVATGFQSDLESTHTSPRLEEWYHRFCASTARLKTYGCLFRLLSG